MSGAVKRNFLLNTSLRKWYYNISGFNQYGLMRDDILDESPLVQKAIARLPEDVRDARTFRIIRALQLSCQKVVLPKEQWTKYEDDVLYLQPYIKEIEKEMKEKKEWDKE